MAREDDFRHGGHADDVRAEQLERTDLGGRLEARAGCGKVAASDRFGPSSTGPSVPAGRPRQPLVSRLRGDTVRARARVHAFVWLEWQGGRWGRGATLPPKLR